MFILQSAFLGSFFANTEEKSSQTKNKPKTARSIPKCLFGVIFLHMEQTTEVAFSDSRPHLGKSFRPRMWIIIKAPKTLSSITWHVTFHQFYGIADWTDYRGKRGLDGLGFGLGRLQLWTPQFIQLSGWGLTWMIIEVFGFSKASQKIESIWTSWNMRRAYTSVYTHIKVNMGLLETHSDISFFSLVWLVTVLCCHRTLHLVPTRWGPSSWTLIWRT